MRDLLQAAAIGLGVGVSIVGGTGLLIYATARGILCIAWMFGLPGGWV